MESKKIQDELCWTPALFGGIRYTEQDVLENLPELAGRRDFLPVQVITLSDGYEHAAGDWLRFNSKFPSGPEKLIRAIHQLDFRAEFWLALFLAENSSDLVSEHPEYFYSDSFGQPDLTVPWHSRETAAILNGARPDVQEYLFQFGRELRRLGVDSVVLDELSPALEKDAKAVKAGLDAFQKGFGTVQQIQLCDIPEKQQKNFRKYPFRSVRRWGGKADAETLASVENCLQIISPAAEENILTAAVLSSGRLTFSCRVPELSADDAARFRMFLDWRSEYRKTSNPVQILPEVLLCEAESVHDGFPVRILLNLSGEKVRVGLPCKRTVYCAGYAEDFPCIGGIAGVDLPPFAGRICMEE